MPLGNVAGESVIAGQITIVYDLFSGQPFASVAVTVKLNVPAAVGVPVRFPSVASERPVGSEPEVTAYEYGAVPPLAEIVWLYAVPVFPPGRLVGANVIVGHEGDVTVREIVVDAVRDCASATLIGRLFAPTLVAIVTVAWKEKILSPDVTSPFVPLSKNC